MTAYPRAWVSPSSTPYRPFGSLSSRGRPRQVLCEASRREVLSTQSSSPSRLGKGRVPKSHPRSDLGREGRMVAREKKEMIGIVILDEPTESGRSDDQVHGQQN